MTDEKSLLKSNIMDKYFELGIIQGFSKVLLDQVATELSISKKTIYKYFSSKEDIISACIDQVFTTIDNEVLPIMSNPSITMLDKITQLPGLVAGHLSFFSRQQVLEIQHAFPELWNKIIFLRKQRIERYEALFHAAKNKGDIIDIDPKIIVEVYLVTIETLTNEDFITEHNLSYAQALQITNRILLEGILKKKNN